MSSLVVDLPAYSRHPSGGEFQLQYSPGENIRTFIQPEGTYCKHVRNFSVLLHHQLDNVITPTFDESSILDGEISLLDRSSVTKVQLILTGQLRSIIMGRIMNVEVVPLLNVDAVIYDSLDGCSSLPSSSIPFSVTLPNTFAYKGQQYQLPPVHDIKSANMYGLGSKCEYTLTVSVTRRTSMTRLMSMNRKERVKIPLRYFPRSRPQNPIIPCPVLLCTVKAAPEAWNETLATLKPKGNSVSVNCLFFTPSVKTFGLSDRIPFHIQLSGTSASLAKLQDSINVKLMRRLVIADSIGYFIIGEAGPLRALPPAWTSSDEEETTMNWDGMIKVKQEEGMTGSFMAANVLLADSIVFAIGDNLAGEYVPLRVVVPIRLVTHPWADY